MQAAKTEIQLDPQAETLMSRLRQDFGERVLA
jgi:hypothetical protein